MPDVNKKGEVAVKTVAKCCLAAAAALLLIGLLTRRSSETIWEQDKN